MTPPCPTRLVSGSCRGRAARLAALLAFVLAASGVGGTPDPAGDRTADGIRGFVDAGIVEGMRWPNFADYRDSLRRFYEPAAFAPAWIGGGRPTPQALALVTLFQGAGEKGLNPEDYDAPRWEARIAGLPSADPARFDVELTVCAMRYVSDLRIGRIHPSHFAFGLNVDQKKYDLARFLRDRIVTAADVPSALANVEPPFGGYLRTRQALARYRALADEGDGEPLPAVARPVEPGQAWDGVPRLVALLKRVGDLPADVEPPDDSRTYGGPLVDAVKRFQRRHGLDADGRIGAATVHALNVPLRDRVAQLQLSLERWRWLPEDFSAPPIVVNIPAFRLRALDENNRVAMEMRVVVGKAMRSQTPVFARDMKYVVLRPYWNVPSGILRREIVPAVRRDRGYLAARNYEVTTHDGKVVASGPVSDDVLAGLQSGKLAVRQKPGASNAMGLVKLIFPNEFSVYLHSTPAPEFFARSRRDFSHGCIRVEKPAELTAWVLRKNPGWSFDRVQREMQSGKDDVRVNLAEPVPVFIVYGTAIAEENGEVHFYEDIYGHDAELASALARGYPYP